MSGQSFRAQISQNQSKCGDIALRLLSREPPEVRELAQRMYDVVSAQPGVNGEGLRTPLTRLLLTMAEHGLRLSFDPVKLEMLLAARLLAIKAMKKANLDATWLVSSHSTTAQGAINNSSLRAMLAAATTASQQPARPQRQLQQQPRVLPQRIKTQPVQQLQLQKQKEAEEEEDEVVVVAQSSTSNALKRRHSLPARMPMVKGRIKPKPHSTPHKVFTSTMCEYCDMDVGVYYPDRIKHTWTKHKEHAYLFIDPAIVCSFAGCDYIAMTCHSVKIHETRGHVQNHNATDYVSEFADVVACTYCTASITTIDGFKQHLLTECKKRDERPCLRCSSCPDSSFHYIFDFTQHLKANGGIAHGNPLMIE